MMSHGPYHSIEDILATGVVWPEFGPLPARCNGTLMGKWGANLERRFGPRAALDIVEALGSDAEGLKLNPSKRDWIPVSAQLRASELIVTRHYEGSWSALYPAVAEDARRGSNRAALLLLRKLGPAKVLGFAPRAFPKLYDRGALDAEVRPQSAVLCFHGARFFEHPTWQVLQVFAQRVLIELAGHRLEHFSLSSGQESCELKLEWSA